VEGRHRKAYRMRSLVLSRINEQNEQHCLPQERTNGPMYVCNVCMFMFMYFLILLNSSASAGCVECGVGLDDVPPDLDVLWLF
jgi:hypothetical protein